MRYFFSALVALAFLVAPLSAQTGPVQQLLQDNSAMILKSSRKTIQPTIDAIVASGLPQVPLVLQKWQAREIWQRKEDGLFFYGAEVEKKIYRLTDVDSAKAVGDYPKKELKLIKPNSGVRGLIATSLVRFQLNDPDPVRRRAALLSIERDPEAGLLAPLRASVKGEADAEILALKQRLNTLLTIRYDPDPAIRIAAINDVAGDLGIDVRATLNPLLTTTLEFSKTALPRDKNIAAHRHRPAENRACGLCFL